jgi:protein arginine kinase
MLNEEDHVRIQAYRAGMDMLNAYEQADKIDDCIGEVLDYAYDERYGYLTTCPSNVGTGMRVSYMCHLPALSWNNRIAGIAAEVGRFGLVLKSIYPDNGRGCGDVYQISNQVTLGRSEREIIENLTNVTEQIVSQERILRRQFNEKRKISVLDGIYRSYGILKYARKISLKDGLMLLSEIRLGLADGLIKTCTQEEYAVYQLMIGIQPANLKLIASDDLSEEEVDIARAEFIRENLPAID